MILVLNYGEKKVPMKLVRRAEWEIQVFIRSFAYIFNKT